MKLRKKEKTLTMAAAKAGMSRNPARKYLKSGKLPSESRSERTWRTRPNPYESVWPEIEGILKQSPTVEATTIFDHLNRIYEGKFEEGQLRTLQRRLKQWRAHYGELKEVMFPQNHEPGHQAQSDFTFMNSLGVTIAGQPFPHMLYHFVLTYSNWETTTLCFGESFESLTLGLQNAIWELGAIPSEHRTDRLSAVVNNLKKGAFARYRWREDLFPGVLFPSRLRRAERGLSTDGGPTVSGDPGAGGPRRGKESRTSSEEPD